MEGEERVPDADYAHWSAVDVDNAPAVAAHLLDRPNPMLHDYLHGYAGLGGFPQHQSIC